MKFIETAQEILLACIVAIMIPIVVYWGGKTFYPLNVESSMVGYDVPAQDMSPKVELTDAQKESETIKADLQIKHTAKVRAFHFWLYLISAFLVIVIGSCINISSLSLGLIGGGVLNVLMTIGNGLDNPAMNLALFLLFLSTLIVIIVKRNNRRNS